jgi:hypothetical protein
LIIINIWWKGLWRMSDRGFNKFPIKSTSFHPQQVHSVSRRACNEKEIISASGHRQIILAKVNCGPPTFVWRMQRQYACNEMGYDPASHTI